MMHGAPHPLHLFLIPASLPSGHRVDVLEVAQHHTPRVDSFRILIDVNNKALDHPLPLDLGCDPAGKTLKEDKTARIGLEGLRAQLGADAEKVFSLELLDPLMHLTNEKLSMGESVRPHPIQEVAFDVIAQRGHWQLIHEFRRILRRCPCPTTTTSAAHETSHLHCTALVRDILTALTRDPGFKVPMFLPLKILELVSGLLVAIGTIAGQSLIIRLPVKFH